MFNLYRLDSLKILLVILIASVSSIAGAGSWTSVGGPLGGLGYDVRIHPGDKNVMYVTDNFAGVSKSINAGQTWSPTNSGITTKGGNSGDAVNIFSLTIDPNNSNTIWAGTFGEGQNFGVFKSVDAGATWSKKTNGISLGTDAGVVFRGFTVQQGNSNVVYAQAEVIPASNPMGWIFQRVKGRVYKSTDGGDSWQLIWQGSDLARYLIIDPGNSNTLYVSHGIFDREPFDSDCARGVYAGVGVLKSSDGGQTWSSINNGITDLSVGSLRMHPSNSQILFATAGNNACSGFGTPTVLGGVFKTVNGGASWTKVLASRNGEPFTTVNFSPSNPNTVYAGSSQAFYRSNDLGATWTQHQKAGTPAYGPPGIAAGFPIDVVIDPDNADTVYVNNYAGGVFRSLDGTSTWQSWSKGYTGAGIRRMALLAGKPWALAVIGKSGPFVSPNYGRDWTGILNGDAATLAMFNWHTIAVHPTNPAVILLADSNAGVVFRSTNNGNDFTLVFKDANAEPIGTNDPLRFQGFRGLAFAPSDPNIVYAGVSVDTSYHTLTPIGTVIYKSADGGGMFTAMPSIIDGNNVNRLIVDPVNSNTVYAATTNGVYKSTNGAASWTYSSGLGSRKIESLAVRSDTIIAGETAGGIWISADSGASWTGPHNTGINSPNPTISALIFDTANANVVYAGDIFSGVYKSSDRGLTWSPFPDSTMSGLTNRAINDLALTDEVIYAATEGGGVFKYAFHPASASTCTLSANPASIPAGGSSILTASCSASATIYSWTGGTCASTTAASCTVTPGATTSYTVSGGNSAGDSPPVGATVIVSNTLPTNRNNYSIIKTNTGYSVRDNVGSGGTVPLSGATLIRFADMTVNLLIGDLSKTIVASDLKTLIELYVAFFNRIPDADGLVYWISQFKAGMSLDQIANSFYQAAVAYSSLTGYTSAMTDAEFVGIIYKNVLGRTGPTAPPDSDVSYWADQITNGTVTRGRMIGIILVAAHGYKGDSAWGWVADLLDNKYSVATFFCLQQGLNYNTAQESITKGMAIAAAVTTTSTAAALALIGVTDNGFNLTLP